MPADDRDASDKDPPTRQPVVWVLGVLATLAAILVVAVVLFWHPSVPPQSFGQTSPSPGGSPRPGGASATPYVGASGKPIVIGYFHGGRTGPLFRAYVKGFFDKAGIAVEMRTHDLKDKTYYTVPHSWEELQGSRQLGTVGKVTGEELVEELMAGRIDGACVGEASFLSAVDKGLPVVAICALAHDTREHPGHAIIFRTGVKINSPQDIKGKVLESRRAGPGDEIILREFLLSVGLDPDKDVTIKSKVDDDRVMLDIDGACDGGYYHLMALYMLVNQGKAWVYRPLNWVPADMAQAVLVFRRDYVEAHGEQVRALLRAYLQALVFEQTLSAEVRNSGPKGLRIDKWFQGMNLPQSDLPPLIRSDSLQHMQDLMVKHHVLTRKVDFTPYIDNHFVISVAAELGLPTTLTTPSPSPGTATPTH